MNKHLITLSISLLIGSAFSQTPTLEDAKNLAQVMSGAWEKNSDDIPKDERGRPAYLIGNLGGKPVRLPQGVVHLVEYDDSPGWNVEKIRNYKPPKRTYDSIIESFGFEFRYTDEVLYDDLKPEITASHAKERHQAVGNYWIDVGITSGGRYGAHFLKNHFEGLFRCVNDFRCYTSLNEEIYGLHLYAVLGINPKTGIPWREDNNGEDYFISFDDKKNPTTIIYCINKKIKRQFCTHYFAMGDNIRINFSLFYNRSNLKDWRIFEEMTKKFINQFFVK